MDHQTKIANVKHGVIGEEVAFVLWCLQTLELYRKEPESEIVSEIIIVGQNSWLKSVYCGVNHIPALIFLKTALK